jgi:DNA-damage-inducible protein J
MAAANLNVRVDKQVKEGAEKVFDELGLTMTAAVNLFLRAVIRENGIPFLLRSRSRTRRRRRPSRRPGESGRART